MIPWSCSTPVADRLVTFNLSFRLFLSFFPSVSLSRLAVLQMSSIHPSLTKFDLFRCTCRVGSLQPGCSDGWLALRIRFPRDRPFRWKAGKFLSIPVHSMGNSFLNVFSGVLLFHVIWWLGWRRSRGPSRAGSQEPQNHRRSQRKRAR